MKNNKIFTILLAVFLSLFLIGCGEYKTKSNDIGEENKVQSESADKKVVSLAPPFFSILLTAKKAPDFVKGVSPITFVHSEPSVIEAVYPGYKEIDTSFVDGNFNINVESLLNLSPNTIFYYGDAQKRGLENVGVPQVNVFLKELDNEKLTVEWEKIMAKSLDIKYEGEMEKSWAKTHNRIKEIGMNENENLKGLFIFSNINGEIKVAGENSHGDFYFKNIKLSNGAQNAKNQGAMAGEISVSMEQINQWNPDYIYVLFGASAEKMIQNEIPGQDWSHINAFKSKNIYQIPKGVFSWGVPSSESPLMPLWLLHTINENYTLENLKEDIKSHYKNAYNVEINDELIDEMKL